MAPARLSQEEKEKRSTVNINSETVTDTADINIPGNWVGEDHAWGREEFKRNLQIQFHYNHPYDASFSVVHISAPIANAFRRILIANLPTVAIERVFMYNNTSIIQDEVLSHRIGLIPLMVPHELLRRLHWPLPREDPEQREQHLQQAATQQQSQQEQHDHPYRDIDTLTFRLKVECTRKAGVSINDDEAEEDPQQLYNNANIYARDIVWVPQGRQATWLGIEDLAPHEIPEHLRVRPANPDILIAKMRPGQLIEMEMHAVKGAGGDHTKFSPVATATYRLLPTINILQPIIGDDAVKFQGCFIPGVIGLEAVTPEESRKKGGQYEGMGGEQKAVVKDAFKDTVSRECLRHEEFQGKVKLGRRRDHFIFSVESTGQYESDVLFAKSIKALKAKCADLRKDLAGIAG